MKSKRLIDLFKEAEDFDLSDNPITPHYRFNIGDKVVDYDHWNGTDFEDEDIGTIRVRVPDIRGLVRKYNKTDTSLYNIDFLADPNYTPYGEDDFVNRPWYLVEYPREDAFEDVKMRWYPEDDLQAATLREEDFDLSDNPLFDAKSLSSILKSNFKVVFNMFILRAEEGNPIGWESTFEIQSPDRILYYIILDFDFADNNSYGTKNFKPSSTETRLAYTQEPFRSLTPRELSLLLQNRKITTLISKHRSKAKSEMQTINIKKGLNKPLQEDISRDEAVTDVGSVQTVADGKRGVAYITIRGNSEQELEVMEKLIQDHGLKSMFVRSQDNPNEPYIVYAPGHEKEANELKDIAEKYNGYLHKDATEQDTIRIGQLLNYKPKEIEDYIEKNYRSDLKEFFNIKEDEDFDLSDNPVAAPPYITYRALEMHRNEEYNGWKLGASESSQVGYWAKLFSANPNTRYNASSENDVVQFFLSLRIQEIDPVTLGAKEGTRWTKFVTRQGTHDELDYLSKPLVTPTPPRYRDFLEESKKILDEYDMEIQRGDYDQFLDDFKGLRGIAEDEDFDLSDNPLVPQISIDNLEDLHGQKLNNWTISFVFTEERYSSWYDESWPGEVSVIFTKELVDSENEPRLKVIVSWELEGGDGSEYTLERYQPSVSYELYIPPNLSNRSTGIYYSLVPKNIQKDIDSIHKLKALAIEQMKFLEDKAQEKLKDKN
jgi:hypothetical protein